MTEVEGAATYPQPEYYVDTLTGESLLGRVAVEIYLESGGHPADIFSLESVLLHEQIQLPTRQLRNRVDGWSQSECIEVASWLSARLSSLDRAPKEMVLNSTILRRASYLGLIASVRQIKSPKLFGSLSELYKVIDLHDANRSFGNLSDDDLVDYVKELIDEFGRLPTVDEMRQRAKDNVRVPPYETIHRRMGGLLRTAEQAGFRVDKSWSVEKCINFGVAFFIANDRMPTQEDIDNLSRKRLSMSAKSIAKRFGGRLSVFKKEIIETYSRMDTIPGYKQMFYEVSNGCFSPLEWVANLRINGEEKSGI